MKEIVFAGGCFWGIEEYFSRQSGVTKTQVGYANGHTESPTYRQVCTGKTGYAEACKVIYNEDTISLEVLLNKFWQVIDPTVRNKQGPDIGSQYRTGIYYGDNKDLLVIQKSLESQQSQYNKPIVTEVNRVSNFYLAEEDHQRYLKKNPNGYCHIDLG